MDKAAAYFPRLLLGIKKAHHDVICEQYPMPDGKINIFVEFSNGEITSKFPHHQKKSAKFFADWWGGGIILVEEYPLYSQNIFVIHTLPEHKQLKSYQH